MLIYLKGKAKMKKLQSVLELILDICDMTEEI